MQSVLRFIEIAVTISKKKVDRDPIKLSADVDESWFYDQWTKDVSTKKIKSRPHKFTGYTDQDKITTLSDLVMEALGSKKNVDDFVLCEKGVNMMKAKLWGNEAPFGEGRWQKLAKEAADGAIPSTEHLSGMRTVRYPVSCHYIVMLTL